MYTKVKDGQYVGLDKFQEGNHAEAIDRLNKSKKNVSKVRKFNWSKKSLQLELRQIEIALDQK